MLFKEFNYNLENKLSAENKNEESADENNNYDNHKNSIILMMLIKKYKNYCFVNIHIT